MKLSPMINLIGGVLIVSGIIVHIVCLSTSHWAGFDFKSIIKSVSDLVANREFPGMKDIHFTKKQLKMNVENAVEGLRRSG